jgi:NAD-dependent DNA ligase
VLFGLSIPNIGAAEAQQFCQHFTTLDALFATGRERLMKLAGVTEVMARSLTHWSGDPVNRKLIRRLEKAGVNFKSEFRQSREANSPAGKSGGGPPQSKTCRTLQRSWPARQRLGLRQPSGALKEQPFLRCRIESGIQEINFRCRFLAG